MTKRVIINYNKLPKPVKAAINAKFPDGIDDQLSRMKHVVKGYFFEGFVFNHEDMTYLIEWEITDSGSKNKALEATIKDEALHDDFDESDIEE